MLPKYWLHFCLSNTIENIHIVFLYIEFEKIMVLERKQLDMGVWA